MLCGAHPDHAEYLLQKQFRTPDEWLGPEGAKWRRSIGYRKPEVGKPFLKAWAAFQDTHARESLDAVTAELKRFHDRLEVPEWIENPQRSRRARSRRLKAAGL